MARNKTRSRSAKKSRSSNSRTSNPKRRSKKPAAARPSSSVNGGSLLIRGGRVIDPAQKLDAECDILLRDGKIAEIAPAGKIRGSAAHTFDARGLVVAPGFIDLHVHLREPGQSHKETIASGTMGAPASPCRTRVAMSTPTVGANAQQADATMKPASAAW